MQSLPHSIETEMAIIGAVILNKSALNIAILDVKASQFYDPVHALMWKVISALYEKNKTIDEITINEYIKSNSLDKGNGFDIGYLITLTSSFPATYNIREYIQILETSYQKREIIKYASKLVTDVTQPGEWGDNLALIQNSFYGLTNAFLIQDDDKHSAKTAVGGLLQGISKRGHLSGIKTGYDALDRYTGGFQPSNVIVLCAVTGMGKTGFALNICSQIASYGNAVMYFSMEMSYELLLYRCISSVSGVASSKLKQHTQVMPALDATDWADLDSAEKQMRGWNLNIYDRGDYTVQTISALAKQQQSSKNGLDIIVIDYLQLISSVKTKSHENRTQEVSQITRSIKQLAMELKIPIILLSQLNREASKGAVRPPVLSDLRDSGSIEQDADVVIAIHSEDYYDPDMKSNSVWDAEIHILKQRNGPIGQINMQFIRPLTKFIEKGNAK